MKLFIITVDIEVLYLCQGCLGINKSDHEVFQTLNLVSVDLIGCHLW